ARAPVELTPGQLAVLEADRRAAGPLAAVGPDDVGDRAHSHARAPFALASDQLSPASTSMSCGRPSTRSAMMLRCTSDVPPPMVNAGANKKPRPQPALFGATTSERSGD